MPATIETAVDRERMKRCLQLALLARRAGNTAVAAILSVDEGVIVEQQEEVPAGNDVFGHAELLAIGKACSILKRRQLPDDTLYTTAEPCIMCAFAIREARIGRVLIGRPTPDIGGLSSSYPVLAADDIARWGAPPLVIWSDLAEEISSALHRG